MDSDETLHKKWSFPLRVYLVNFTKSASVDLVIFTKEIPNWRLYFLCSESASFLLKILTECNIIVYGF